MLSYCYVVADGATRLISPVNSREIDREMRLHLSKESKEIFYLHVSQNLESKPTAETVKALLDNQCLVSAGKSLMQRWLDLGFKAPTKGGNSFFMS